MWGTSTPATGRWAPWHLDPLNMSSTFYLHQVDHCQPYEGFRDRADRRFLDQFILTPGEEEVEELSEEQKEQSEEEEREVDDWVTVSVAVPGKQFLDSYRLLHPHTREAFTCWNTEKNCR